MSCSLSDSHRSECHNQTLTNFRLSRYNVSFRTQRKGYQSCDVVTQKKAIPKQEKMNKTFYKYSILPSHAPKSHFHARSLSLPEQHGQKSKRQVPKKDNAQLINGNINTFEMPRKYLCFPKRSKKDNSQLIFNMLMKYQKHFLSSNTNKKQEMFRLCPVQEQKNQRAFPYKGQGQEKFRARVAKCLTGGLSF